MLKLLIFDLGKVLVDYDWDSFCRSIAYSSGANFEVVEDFFAHDYFHKGRYEVGMVKPESEIYKEVLKRCGVLAEESLFIDDMLINVESAQALGIHGHHFGGIKPLRLILQAHGFSLH